MQVAAMDKLYYFVIKCNEQFSEPDRIAELNTAAWDASPQTTEMYQWIHMYFCDGQKKVVPFNSKQAAVTGGSELAEPTVKLNETTRLCFDRVFMIEE